MLAMERFARGSSEEKKLMEDPLVDIKNAWASHPSTPRTWGSAQWAQPALALEARNIAFLARPSHTMPTTIYLLTVSVATCARFSNALAACHSFCCSPISTFHRHHSHYILFCCLLGPALAAHSFLQCVQAWQYARRDAMRQVCRAEKEASRIRLDVHLATSIGVTAAPPQPMAPTAQLTSPLSARALSFSVRGPTAKIFAKMPYLLLIT